MKVLFESIVYGADYASLSPEVQEMCLFYINCGITVKLGHRLCHNIKIRRLPVSCAHSFQMTNQRNHWPCRHFRFRVV